MSPDSPASRRVGPLRARLRAATEREILRAAEAAIAEQGLDGLSVSDIAARAGVAVGTLYNYFRDRDALVGALFRERRAAFAEALAGAARESAGAPFAEQFRGFVRAAFAEFDGHRDFFRSALESEAWRRHAPATDERRSRRVMRQMRDGLSKLVELGLSEGVLRRDRAALHGAVLYGVVYGLFAERLRGEAAMPVDELADLALDIFLHGAGGGR